MSEREALIAVMGNPKCWAWGVVLPLTRPAPAETMNALGCGPFSELGFLIAPDMAGPAPVVYLGNIFELAARPPGPGDELPVIRYETLERLADAGWKVDE